QPVLRVEIPKPDGGKRLLGIPTVVDRVIQQAIAQVLTKVFDSQFSEYSYGFRHKRYAEMAIIQALEYMNDRYDWIVDIDLERFFDTVNHDRLMNLISRKVDDGDVISLKIPCKWCAYERRIQGDYHWDATRRQLVSAP